MRHKWLCWAIVACTETNVHPTQSNDCIDLVHMSHPYPNPPELLCPLTTHPLHLPHLFHLCTLLFLAKENNHYITYVV
jgi:hypothetical protein